MTHWTVVARFGFSIGPGFPWDCSGGDRGGVSQALIDVMVSHAQLKMQIPLDNSVRWVAITGHSGLKSVIGKGYRGFKGSDFQAVAEGRWVCYVSLVPRSAIPSLCDRPGCDGWAIYHYTIEELNTDSLIYVVGATTFWGKTVGEHLHVCREHALELQRLDSFPPRLRVQSMPL